MIWPTPPASPRAVPFFLNAPSRKPSLAEMYPRLPYPFSRPDGHPHVFGRLLRDLNVAGLHGGMSDTAYENHGKTPLGLPADPLYDPFQIHAESAAHQL